MATLQGVEGHWTTDRGQPAFVPDEPAAEEAPAEARGPRGRGRVRAAGRHSRAKAAALGAVAGGVAVDVHQRAKARAKAPAVGTAVSIWHLILVSIGLVAMYLVLSHGSAVATVVRGTEHAVSWLVDPSKGI